MKKVKLNSLSLNFQKRQDRAVILRFYRGCKLQFLLLLGLGCCGGTKLIGQHAIGLNTGVFKPKNSTGAIFGAGLDYTYQASDNVRVGIGAAYYANSKVSSTRLNGIYTYTLREGVFSPYAGADLGLYFIDEYTGFRVDETMGVGLAPLLGAHYKLSEGLALDVRVKYPLMLAIDKGGKGFFPTPYGLTALECNVGAIVFF
jgi:outer membrane protein W